MPRRRRRHQAGLAARARGRGRRSSPLSSGTAGRCCSERRPLSLGRRPVGASASSSSRGRPRFASTPVPSARAAFSSAMAASASGAGVRSSRAIPHLSLEHVVPRLKGGPAWPENEVCAARPVTAGEATPRHWTGSQTASGGGSARTARRSGPASSASTGRSPSAGDSGGRGPTSPVNCGGSRERSRRAAGVPGARGPRRRRYAPRRGARLSALNSASLARADDPMGVGGRVGQKLPHRRGGAAT